MKHRQIYTCILFIVLSFFKGMEDAETSEVFWK
jgi:hypothetical protein